MTNRVLFIIPSLNYGGAELLMIQQLKGLRERGWICYIVVLSGKSSEQQLNESVTSLAEQVLIIDSPMSFLNATSIIYAYKNHKELVDFVIRYGVSVVVAHLPIAHFWGRLLKRKLPKVRLIIYHHSMQYQANPLNTLGKRMFNYFQRSLSRRTDNVSICISQAVERNIEQHFVLNNPVVLYNAVTDKLSAIECFIKKKENSNEINILLPGRLHSAKGHMFFLPVFKQLIHENNFPLQLTIAGGGPLEEEIKTFLNTNNLENLVTITGFLSNEDLLCYMYAADFIIIPSISEGLGLVAIEALMLGKTVIASDAGGLKEVIVPGKNGYMFQAGNHVSCLNVLESVLSEFPSSLLPTAALREDYKRRFSFDTYIKKFAAILNE